LKEALQAEVGLPIRPDVPLFGFIGRLEEQKGSDILAEAVKDFLKDDVQLIVLVREWLLHLSQMYLVFDGCLSCFASFHLTSITPPVCVFRVMKVTVISRSCGVEVKVFLVWIGNRQETAGEATGGVGQLVPWQGCGGGEVQHSFGAHDHSWGRLHSGAQPV
jgi:hypothetical protein